MLRRVIYQGIIMALLIVVLYVAGTWILSRVRIGERRIITILAPYHQRIGGQEALMLADLKQCTSPEIIVFGSSHAYRGYDPRIFEARGWRLFNAGSSSQHVVVSKVLLERYVEPESHPLIILDIYDRMFTGQGLESTNRMIANLPDEKAAWDLVRHKPDLRTWNAMLVRWLSKGMPSEAQARDYIRDGYCSRPDTTWFDPADAPIGLGNFNPSDEFFRGLRSFIEECQKRRLRLVLVSHPVPDVSLTADYRNAFLSSFLPVINEYNVPYLDYTRQPGFDPMAHFFDENHLNQAGVDLFNELLIQDLVNSNLLEMKQASDENGTETVH